MKNFWWKEAVVYQIYPPSFQDSNGDGMGDISGIILRLPYLRQLGVDVIWLSPFYPSLRRDNGYHVNDYQAIPLEFGVLEDFDRLLHQAHRMGLKIVIDLVINYTSKEHHWFQESRKSRDNPYRDYYIWRDGVDGEPPNNWGSLISGSAWTLDETTGQYYLHTLGDAQLDLNWDNPAVRQEIYKIMRWWCERGVDGFHIDVTSISKLCHMPDGEVKQGDRYSSFVSYTVNSPRIHELLQEMNQEVLSKYDLLIIGKCPGLMIEQINRYASEDGTELNMAFRFEYMDLNDGENFKWNLRKTSPAELKETISKWQYTLASTIWYSLYWGNHDQPRIVSRLGDVSSFEMRERSAKALTLYLHMMRGISFIYAGEELGMTNGDFQTLTDFRDAKSLRAYDELTGSGTLTPEDMLRCMCCKSRDNARTPMQWSSDRQASFTTGRPWIKVNSNYVSINAAEQIVRLDSVFHFYQQLIFLRHHYQIIVYGSYHLLWPEDHRIFAYTRCWEGQILLVICNLSREPVQAELPYGADGKKPLIANMIDVKLEKKMMLRPWEAFAVLLEDDLL